MKFKTGVEIIVALFGVMVFAGLAMYLTNNMAFFIVIFGAMIGVLLIIQSWMNDD
jgi:hypothetical protein